MIHAETPTGYTSKNDMMSTSAAWPRMLTQREVTRQMKAKQAAEDAAAARAPAGKRYAASRAAAIAVAEKKAAAEAQAKKAATEKAVASIIKKVASTVCQAVVRGWILTLEHNSWIKGAVGMAEAGVSTEVLEWERRCLNRC